MFQKVHCTLELSEKFGRDYPEFMLPIRFEAERRLPLTKLDLYSFTTDKATYYYAYKIQKVIKKEVYFTCLGEYEEEDFLKGFCIFVKTVNFLEPREQFSLVGDQIYTDAVIPLLEKFNYTYEEYPTVNYFISREQEKLLMEAPEIPLPEGYELGSCTTDDAKFITDNWIHNAPGEDEQANSCVRYKGTLAAFELVHANGMLNHLYVMPEHRGKRLGLIVEQDMAKRLIKHNHLVYKTVETFNTHVLKASDTCYYWTSRKKADGTPNLRVYLEAWPKENNDDK